MTKKEKEVTKIIYRSFKKSGSRSVERDYVIKELGGMINAADLAQLLDYGKSLYFESRGGSGSLVQITSRGIEYMEKKTIRIIKEVAFWLIFVSTALAAIYAILNYYSIS